LKKVNEALCLDFYSTKLGAEKGDRLSGQRHEMVLHPLPDRQQQRGLDREGDDEKELQHGFSLQSISVHFMSRSDPGIHSHE
jgi:hypothetical protein